ncbi:hypothetical protein Tco_0258035, partial [Tanacetum coccineum]
EMGDSTGVSVSLGGGISSEGGNRYSLKDKNKAKTDKIEHENGKSVKSQKVKSQSQQVNDEAETKEILSGHPVPI